MLKNYDSEEFGKINSEFVGQESLGVEDTLRRFEQMKQDPFIFSPEQITSQEASGMLKLLKLSETFLSLSATVSDAKETFPEVIFEAYQNVKQRLGPWKGFLERVVSEENFNREKAKYKVVQGYLNRQYLHKKLR